MTHKNRIIIVLLVIFGVLFSAIVVFASSNNSNSTTMPLQQARLQNLKLATTNATYESASFVSAGNITSCLVTESGSVKCWGDDFGLTPTAVNGLNSGVKEVYVGYEHSCALMENGGVKCWGNNNYGQLGNGSTTDSSTPVDVVGLTSGVKAVDVGIYHTCALMESGAVKCWGHNASGQLGDGSTNSSSIPVDVVGLNASVKAITTGTFHSCAVTDNGAAKCWGANWYGQIGDGTTTNHTTPTNVSGLNSGVATISGGDHTCAVMDDGDIKCWGINTNGELGDGTTTQRLSPTDVVGLTKEATSVSVGGHYTCARLQDNSVQCWGDGWAGQLGDGEYRLSTHPVQVNGLEAGVIQLDTGKDHSCVLMFNGGVKCWGRNYSGQLGDGNQTGKILEPVNAERLDNIASIDAGDYHNCAITTSGNAKCWGKNTDGQLGNDNDYINSHLPQDVATLNSDIVDITSGGSHSCSISNTGEVKCWGLNNRGQLGNGSTTFSSNTPTNVSGLNSGAQAIAAGWMHTCAIVNNGGVQCWGDNTNGKLGDGTTTNRTTPVNVINLNGTATAITAGTEHTCALMDGGSIKCWGDNVYGQLGNGTQTDQTEPVDVIDLDGTAVAISAGGYHTCALMSTGEVKCWGDDSDGQLGNGNNLFSSSTPTNVIGLDSAVSDISAGLNHTCAVMSNGSIKCWGGNLYGQLGNGSITADSEEPIDVNGISSGAVKVTAGDKHTCSLMSNHTVKCWGYNESGETGSPVGYGPTDVTGFIHTLIVTITQNGNDIQLTWQHQSANTEYQVWRETSPYTEPDNTSTPLSTVNPPTSGEEVTYIDNTANTTGNYYYKIHGLDSSSNTASTSNEVGIFRFTLQAGSP